MSESSLDEHPALIRLGKAEQALANAKDLGDLKHIIDVAEAARVYARAAKIGEHVAHHAEEIKLRAQRKAGEFLSKLQKDNRGGDRKSPSQAANVISSYKAAVEEAGIGKDDAWRYQQVAAVPTQKFNAYLNGKKEEGEEISTSGLLREFRVAQKKEKQEAIVISHSSEDTCTVEDLTNLRGKKFGCVYADPPWLYGNQGTRAATANHYGGMTVDEICALPISDLVAENAHLHLWTTNAFLFDAKRVIESWGFEYKSCFVWVKPQMGIGNYWRVSHEFMLLGVRGDATFRNRSLMSWGQFDRTEHSAKPEPIRKMIESASPGPYLELFGRKVATGWTVWGNQIKRTMFDDEVREVVA